MAFILTFVLLLSQCNAQTENSRERDFGGNDQDSSGVFSFLLEHALSDRDPHASFTSRGRVEVHFSHLNRISGSSSSPTAQGQRLGSVHMPETILSDSDLRQFQKLVEKNGYYRIRLSPIGRGDENSSNKLSTIVASVPACALEASQFRELFTFYSDVYGNLLGVDYTTPIADCHYNRASRKSEVEVSLKAKGKLSLGRPGERPRTGVVEEKEKEKEKEGSPEKDKSFLQKYWMYLLPVAIIMMMNTGGAAAPAAAAGNTGGGAR